LIKGGYGLDQLAAGVTERQTVLNVSLKGVGKTRRAQVSSNSPGVDREEIRL